LMDSGSKRHPRLALFLPNLKGGGAERVMVNLAQGFLQQGCAVDMVLVKAEGVYQKQLPEQALIIDLGVRSTYLALPALRRYLRQQEPQALLSTLNLTNLVALLARRFSSSATRVVIRVASTVSLQKRTPLKKIMERQALHWLYPWADEIVAVSKGVADDLAVYAGIERQRIRVVYNPVITPRLHQLASLEAEHPWFKENSVPVILGVGRLSAPKSFATLVEAFALVRRQRPARLVIFGEGEQRVHLENLAHALGVASDFALPGFTSNPYAHMRRAAVFALCSLWEGLPNVLIEAMACGCPVVSSDCPSGPTEILAGGRYGHLFPPQDAEALASAILQVLSGDRRLPPASWLRQFDQEVVVGQYLHILGVKAAVEEAVASAVSPPGAQDERV
jgi:glycosyltransferase involved in cell wall biosynthesis